MDPFDEFEFKPLTDGLGFHKKKAATANSQTTASIPQTATSTRRATFEEEAIENLLPPLPRKNSSTETTPTQDNSNSTVDEILKTLRQNQRLDFDTTKRTTKKTATTAEEYVLTNWNFSSTFLDSMLIVASSLLCMIILLVITKADLIANLTQPDEAGLIYLSTLAMFAGVTFIYMTVNRVFMGATPGEWAFDQRIGKPEEMTSPYYVLKVIARSLIVMATGFVVMPVLSLIMGRDVAGSITGASLYRKA